MDAATRDWFAGHTSTASDWPMTALLSLKRDTRSRISVVVPARDEQHTIAAIVAAIRGPLMTENLLVDEVVVIDSDSVDGTAAVAAAAGAVVHASADIRPDLGSLRGKGEALWKSTFVTSGDIIVFVDGDVTDFSSDFVRGLIGPLLADPEVALVKGFYRRDLHAPGADGTDQGGRVTELTARPLISVWWPELAAVVQPLAGEWAIRRDLLEQLPIPAGYGVELATLVDTFTRRGTAAIAQVDLGERHHRHHDLGRLGVMAAEVVAAATARRHGQVLTEQPAVARFPRDAAGLVTSWEVTVATTAERPPAATVASQTVGRFALTSHGD